MRYCLGVLTISINIYGQKESRDIQSDGVERAGEGYRIAISDFQNVKIPDHIDQQKKVDSSYLHSDHHSLRVRTETIVTIILFDTTASATLLFV